MKFLEGKQLMWRLFLSKVFVYYPEGYYTGYASILILYLPALGLPRDVGAIPPDREM